MRVLSAAVTEMNAQKTSVKFAKNNEFQAELRRRVDEFFSSTGRPRRDVPQMYLKTTVLLAALVGLYVTLVFFVQTFWLAIPLAVLLGLTLAEIGFNIQHDGGHEGYSDHGWVNKLMAFTLDLIGGSSYFWHYKHGVYHHTYVNITHEDADIDLGILARLSPHQKRYGFHRWQQFYIWPLYGLAALKWQLIDDLRQFITGRIGEHRVPRPRSWNLLAFIAGKLIFLSLAFGVPMLFHPIWIVALIYGVTAMVLGITLTIVFQLAHVVEDAQFPLPQEGNMEAAWAVHQVQTTVDFARRSRVVAWLLGGLNFQIEHHLLPRICHVNYPALSPIVQETCRKYGIKYNEHKSFRAGVVSHFRWLRELGRRAIG